MLQAHRPASTSFIDGLLVVGKLSNSSSIQKKMERLAGDAIRVETYSDLHRASNEYYKNVDGRLKGVAPEYARGARRERKKT